MKIALSFFLLLLFSGKNTFAAIAEFPPNLHKFKLGCEGQLTEPLYHILAAHFLNPEVPYERLIDRAVEHYPELRWLSERVALSPEDKGLKANPNSHSVRIFGKFYPEFDRTATSLVLLAQLLRNDYEAFTAKQPAPLKLSPEDFNWTRQLLLRALSRKIEAKASDISLERLDALIAYMAFHDLGKSKSFADIVDKVYSAVDASHDQILVHGIAAQPLIAPSFARLAPQLQTIILKGLKSGFNFCQLPQGENVAASLLGLSDLDAESFDFFIIHSLLDFAGAGGAKEPLSSATMHRFTFPGYKTGDLYLRRLFEGQSPQDVYKAYIFDEGKKRGLEEQSELNFALARLMLLARAHSAEDIAMVKEAFAKLDDIMKANLVTELNVMGIGDQNALLLEYAPAFFANALKDQDKRLALTTSLQIFSAVFAQSRQSLAAATSTEGSTLVNIKALGDKINQMRDDKSEFTMKDLLGLEFKITEINSSTAQLEFVEQ